MSANRHYVENPPHVDERRMRHISDAEFFAALDAGQTGGASNYARLRAHLSVRGTPQLGVNTLAHLQRLRALGSPRVPEILHQAGELQCRELDYTDRSVGRSDLYHLNRLSWLTPLVEAYLLTGESEHVRAFARLLNAWYDARDCAVGDWPGLDVNWYTLNLGMRSRLFCAAISAFRDAPELDDTTLAHLLKSELAAGRWLAEEHSCFRYGNWQFVGAACLLELACFWPEFAEAAGWRQVAWARILDHLALDVYADGGHLERSAGYHHYPLGTLCDVAPMLDVGRFRQLTQHPRFRAMFRWSLQHCTPVGCSTDFNDSGYVDCGPVAVRGAVLCGDAECKWLAEQFGTPEEIATTLASIPTLPDGRDAVRVFANIPSRAPDTASVLLSTSKFAILRRGLQPDSLYMAVTYGPFVSHELEPHSHYDPLSFVCFGHGAPLAIEAGGPRSYDELPTYYTWYQAACSHNLVLVDDRNPSTAKDARLVTWSASPVADLFGAEHEGYQDVCHRRTILFVPDDYWVVFDQIAQHGQHRLAWQLYTPQPFTMQGAALHPNAAPGLMVLPVGECVGASVEAIHGDMTVPGVRAYQGQHTRRDVQGVRRTIVSDRPTVAFTHVLYACPKGDSVPDIRAQELPALDGDVQAFALATPHGEDYVAFSPAGTTTKGRTVRFASDAHVLLVRAGGAWAGFGLSCLEDAEGQVLFQASMPVNSIALQPAAHGLRGEIDARAQTVVRLAVPRPSVSVALNGIVVPQADSGTQSCFQLPAEGRYTLEVAW